MKNDITDMSGENKQICLRCNKEPALRDGSDDGCYYCKNCIEARKKIDKEVIEMNRMKEEREKSNGK